jgi:hypothetical protein
MMNNDTLIKCKTEYIGKYLDFDTNEEYELEVYYAKSLCRTFLFYLKTDYDIERNYLELAISYPSELFLSDDYAAVIKTFMLVHCYCHLRSETVMKRIDDYDTGRV